MFFLVVFSRLWAVSFTDFDRYQGQLSREVVAEKIAKYLEKNPEIRGFYRLREGSLELGDFAHGQVDYVLHFGKGEKKKEKKKQGLKGARIAIDPGHFGGELAELEERLIAVEGERFCEGDLTFLTAMVLKELLEKEGAVVYVTRSEIGKGAYEEAFSSWVKGREGDLGKLFREEYNREDLYSRVKKVNAFHPDITVVIHYNAYQTKEEALAKKVSVVKCNYNLSFIPGAFGAGELRSVEDRYAFLRLIVSDDLEESLVLSRSLMKGFKKVLQVPPITKEEDAPYLRRVCIDQGVGIYSRNLVLTRLVESPLCYGETLIQNSWVEIHRLGALETEVRGLPCSKRIKEVAEAYFVGIRDYFEKRSVP